LAEGLTDEQVITFLGTFNKEAVNSGYILEAQ
jgi:hypothetical protein